MTREATAGDFVSPASIARPDFLTPSAWLEHAPFAFWLIDVLRPATIVELGTHTGFSYLCMCQAIAQLGIPARGFAVDTWEGDEHTGFYGPEVYSRLEEYHDERYAGFSRLLRASFDDAVPQFEDGSIDLLHIDGGHVYDVVCHDYETWCPKLSPHGVVLLHDTNVRDPGFGVHRLWAELRRDQPGFEFVHGHGLGVLRVGTDIPPLLDRLVGIDENAALAAALRQIYGRLGAAVRMEFQLREARSAIDDQRADMDRERADHHDALQARAAEIVALEEEVAALGQKHKTAIAEVLASRSRELAQLEDELASRARELTAQTARAVELDRTLSELLSSESWRLTEPLRRLGRWSRSTGRLLRRRGARPVSRPSKRTVLRPSRRAARSPSRSDALARVVFVSGEPSTPGHRYRVDQLASALAPRFFEVEVIDVLDLKFGLDLSHADVLWIWRARSSSELRGVIDAARAAGTRIVYDIDDLMFRPELADAKLIDGIRSQRFGEGEIRKLYGDIQHALIEADHCTASTAPLAREMRRFGKPTTVIPNGFTSELLRTTRPARRSRGTARKDTVIRLGYAAGTLTHQRDLGVAVQAIARVLDEHPDARFVTFQEAVDIDEFPDLRALLPQIEMRAVVPIDELPAEYARFDINLVPLETGNPYCEAKSELKYFEAALAGAVTVASPTEPLSAAIRHRETGLLAASERDWYELLSELIEDADMRARISKEAYRDVLWRFGPERRNQLLTNTVTELLSPPAVAASLARSHLDDAGASSLPVVVADCDVLYESQRVAESRVAVVVPLFNYSDYVVHALESLSAQTVTQFDVVVVDDHSTDGSPEIVKTWMQEHGGCFNSASLLRNKQNSHLARTRNTAVMFADTELFFPVDPDNQLLPTCIESAVALLDETGAAVAFPTVELFGDGHGTPHRDEWNPSLLRTGNYIDAMALVRRASWLAVGGYTPMETPGWEDYDLWCKFVERGFFGVRIPETTARYRVHGESMLRTLSDQPEHNSRLVAEITNRHPWLSVHAGVSVHRGVMSRGNNREDPVLS